jgi:hypothetical protein
VVPGVRAVLLKYAVAHVRQQGPNVSSPMIWVMVDVGLGGDQERTLRREIAQIPGATIRS